MSTFTSELQSRFKLKSDSKFQRPSAIQAEARNAIEACAPQSGIVVLPCGTGKTAIFIDAALQAGVRVLFLCYEKQGVLQVAESIKSETTVRDSQLCVYTSHIKKHPNSTFCYMVTTYGMFTDRANASSETTRTVKAFVLSTEWDLVVCDEVHHAAASTYKPLIELLAKKARRVLGFTGTLCRHEFRSQQETAIREGVISRESAMHDQFKFIGPVLYSRSCRDLETDGLIAKLHLMEVHAPMTTQFTVAHGVAQGSARKYVESLHPNKLKVVWQLVQMHRKVGHIGMIFVYHLLHAKVLQEMLGDEWEILSGGSAYGTDGVHTAEANANIIKRFNDRKLTGIISTAVGESALDAFHDDFRFGIVVDGHSGAASASQRLGRLSRTPRIEKIDGELESQFCARRMACQKHAAYYDVVTPGTEEANAALARRAQFEYEGYNVDTLRTHDALFDAASTTQMAPCVYDDEDACLGLLIDTLSYRALGDVEVGARAESKATRNSHLGQIKELKQAAEKAKSAVMKERKLSRVKILQKQTTTIAKNRVAMNGRVVSETARKVLRQLGTPLSTLKRIGVSI